MMREEFQKTARDYAQDAKFYRRNDNLHMAEQALEEGLAHYPDNGRLLVALGDLYRDRRRDHLALETYGRAFALHPQSQAAVMGFANFLTIKRNYGKAEDVYAHMYAINGETDMRLLCAIGNLYQKSGEMALSAACFGRAVLLPSADEYARGRYTEICGHYSPGYREAEWINFTARMEDRKGVALAAAASTVLKVPAQAPFSAALVQADQPVADGPVRS